MCFSPVQQFQPKQQKRNLHGSILYWRNSTKKNGEQVSLLTQFSCYCRRLLHLSSTRRFCRPSFERSSQRHRSRPSQCQTLRQWGTASAPSHIIALYWLIHVRWHVHDINKLSASLSIIIHTHITWLKRFANEAQHLHHHHTLNIGNSLPHITRLFTASLIIHTTTALLIHLICHSISSNPSTTEQSLTPLPTHNKSFRRRNPSAYKKTNYRFHPHIAKFM